MNAIKINARTFYRKYRYLLLITIILALVSSFPGMLAVLTNQPGNLPIAAAAGDPVIAAAGDIACDPANSAFNNGLGNPNGCRQKYTSDLLVNLANAGLAGVLDLGDNQYYCGGYQAYLQAYDPSWGRLKSITHPSVGNHEYLTSGGTDCSITNEGATGYFQYFGAAAGTLGQGYYSFDIGTWHIIALNTNCGNVGGCGSTSPQYKWLQADLASHTNFCTLAFWHIPLYSSGGRANANSKPFWNLLYANNADLILNGHDHIYERFAPQDPNGAVDLVRGIPEFIVGTGGADHTSLSTIAANSIVRNTNTFGVLELTLHPTGYDWQFIPEAGKTFTDSGSASCHGTVPNTPTPTPTLSGSITPTPTPTGTPTSTFTPTATATSNVTLTPTPTITPTTTLVNTPTATSTPVVTNTPSPTPGTASVKFNPVADSYVNAGSTGTNYGSSTTMRLDASPDLHAYLRFNLSGLAGTTISQVRLLLYANNSDSSGIRAWAVADNAWGELTTNYTNAPALGSQLASSGPLASIGWVSMDVTSYITGDGTYSFGVTNLSSTAISVDSREFGAANAPQLIVTFSGSASATSTPTPTFTLTPVTTSTPTPASTPTPTSVATPTPTPVFSPTPTQTATPVSTPVSTPTPTPTGASGSLTFIPVADTYVNAASTTSNYGSSTTLRLDGSPDVHAYLRFTISGFSGTISQVRLLLFANNSDSSGVQAFAVADNTWGELTTNYTNAPALGSLLASSGSFPTSVWVSLDVTSYITGNGTYSIGVTNLSSTAISVGSRESGANAPQLVITYH